MENVIKKELRDKLATCNLENLIIQIKDKDEIISLLKEKIERLENENIALQQNKRSK